MIKTGIKGLNQIIKGYKNEITMVYGGAATGKTTLCMMLALDLAKKGNKILFIDTENSFSIERAQQIAPNFQYMVHNIFLFKIKNFEEQKKFFEKLPQLAKEGEFSAIILDTLGMHYRRAVKEDSYTANKELSKELDFLKQLSKNVPVLISNQIYSKMDGNDSPVGGNMVKNFCDCLIELRNNSHRELEIKTPFSLLLKFDIKEEGVVI